MNSSWEHKENSLSYIFMAFYETTKLSIIENINNFSLIFANFESEWISTWGKFLQQKKELSTYLCHLRSYRNAFLIYELFLFLYENTSVPE